MLRILGRATSINVRKVLWTCEELGLPFVHEGDWATPAQPAQSAQFLRLNPNGQVPVIVEGADGGFVLWESNTICRYLAAQHAGAGLLPADPRDRALVEQWMDWQAGDLNSAWRYAYMALVRQHADYPDAAAIQRSAASWNRHMQLLDAQVAATGAFVTGAAFTLADIVLGLSVHRWRSSPIERPALPALQRYTERLATRPACRRHCAAGVP